MITKIRLACEPTMTFMIIAAAGFKMSALNNNRPNFAIVYRLQILIILTIAYLK